MRISAKRTCYASVYSVFAASGPRGWVELPEDLLQCVVALLGSSRDLLAFGATCRPWRDLFSVCTCYLQPLLLHPSADSKLSPQFNRWTTLQGCKWRLADPAGASSYPSLLSLSDLRGMFFLRCSYGHLIFFDSKGFYIVNTFSGAKVVPPCLIFCDDDGFYIVNAFSGSKVVPPCLKSDHFTSISYATLTAPVASDDSHLLVGSGAYLFRWRIGSDSWLEHYPKVNFLKIEQVVALKGKTYALGSFGSFCIVQFLPSLLIQKFEVIFEEGRIEDLYWTNQKIWLVVCGDALLLIKLEATRKTFSDVIQFKVFKLESLDAVTKKARWVKVGRLDNWAIFVSADVRCEALPCMNPEKWGGRSNHIYFPSYQAEQPWAAVNHGKNVTTLQHVRSSRTLETGTADWSQPGSFPAHFLAPVSDDLGGHRACVW